MKTGKLIKTSKMIKKKIRTIRKRGEAKQNHKHSELKDTTSIKTRRKNILIQRTRKTKMTTSKYDRQDIADVFAELFEDLYTLTTKKHEHAHEDKYEQHQDTMKPFTMQELNPQRQTSRAIGEKGEGS